jgi:putative aldouronate transport system permease protein
MNVTSRSKGDTLFDAVNYMILSIVLLVVLYPLYFIVIASFSDPTAVNNGSMLFWPKDITLDGYKRVFKYTAVWIGFRNTVFYTIAGTLISVAVTMGFAYTLSRKKFFGKSAMTIYLLIPMFFSGGLIPTYLFVKNLGLLDTWVVMIIMGMVNVFNVIITRTFIQASLPEELYEAAQMDGCNHLTYFFKIVLPLSSSIIAVIVLYYGVDHWNDFFTSLVYLSNSNLFSLQLVLRGILIASNVQADLVTGADDVVRMQNEIEQLKYALIIVTSLPILAVYPFLQKYFVKGVMIGSVKS